MANRAMTVSINEDVYDILKGLATKSNVQTVVRKILQAYCESINQKVEDRIVWPKKEESNDNLHS